MQFDEIDPSDETLKKGRAKLAAELRKLAMLAEGGRLPVLCAVYQVQRADGNERSCGVVLQVHGDGVEIFAAVGQLHHLTQLAAQAVPNPDGSTYEPEGVPS